MEGRARRADAGLCSHAQSRHPRFAIAIAAVANRIRSDAQPPDRGEEPVASCARTLADPAPSDAGLGQLAVHRAVARGAPTSRRAAVFRPAAITAAARATRSPYVRSF